MTSACSSTRYMRRSFELMRRDRQPLSPCRRGSGLPVPVKGVAVVSLMRLRTFMRRLRSADARKSKSSKAFLENSSFIIDAEEGVKLRKCHGDGFAAFGLGEPFADVGGKFGVGEDVGGFLFREPVVVWYHDNGGFAPFDEDGLGVSDTGVHEFGEVLAGGAVGDGFCVHAFIVQFCCTFGKFFNLTFGKK